MSGKSILAPLFTILVRIADRSTVYAGVMNVEELRNEALVRLHEAEHSACPQEAAELRRSAARLLATADSFERPGGPLLGHQPQLRAA